MKKIANCIIYESENTQDFINSENCVFVYYYFFTYSSSPGYGVKQSD